MRGKIARWVEKSSGLQFGDFLFPTTNVSFWLSNVMMGTAECIGSSLV